MNPNASPTAGRTRRWQGMLAGLATAALVVGVAVAGPETPASAARSSSRNSGATARPTTAAAATNATSTTAPPTTSAPSATATTKVHDTSTTSAPRGRAQAVTQTTGPTTTTAAKPASTRVLFGAETGDSASSLAQLSSFESHAGKNASLFGYYASFFYDTDFNVAQARAISDRGTTPMLTWEPWDPTSGSVNQPAYSLAKIASGSFDAYLTRWANEIKGWNRPLWVRFAHEMNGDWYPWSEGVNGNTPGQYVAAWRHVHDVFVNAGVTNVTWVWTPNVLIDGQPSLASLYPGDAYVDWIGFDGYNWGTSASWSTWQSPTGVMEATLAALRQVSSRPIVIGETSSTEVGGPKAEWVQQFFSMLAANPDIKAFLWFNLNKENDWRIESSPAVQAAFATGVADSRFVGA